MKLLRRLKLTILCLLAVLLVGGSAVPSPALWQCHYSSRIVSAAFGAAPSAMPCLMGSSAMNGTMPSMPCCRPAKSTAYSNTLGKQTFSPPACHPTLTSLAVPALGMTETSFHLRRNLAAMQASLPLTAAFAVSTPITLALRQRPPPTVTFPSSTPAYSFGLPAPPVA